MSVDASPPEQLLARILGDMSNAALALDPLSRARLAPLSGRCARFDVVPPGGGAPRPLTIVVTDTGLECRAGTEPAPHVILTGALPDLVRRLTGARGDGTVSIEGDEAVLTELAALFTHLQPDLAAPLGNVIGQPLADDLLGLAEAGFAFLRSAAESVTTAARRDTVDAFVNRDGFERLITRLEALRLRVDRLEARTRQLETAPAEPGDGP